jgi:hypothetical protein
MKIAVWYHCVLTGPRIPSTDHAIAVLSSQMSALRDSGLAAAADRIDVCVNGNDSDALTVCAFIPEKSSLHMNPDGQSELPTLHRLRNWLKPGWAVLYHHIKGVQYPNHPVWDNWRKCMERACVWNWRTCVQYLEKGFDTVGAHWLRNKEYTLIPPGQKYWGGTFWWATSDYLLTLPELAADSHENRYEAEVWIGKSSRQPKVHDFEPHWPMHCRP